MTTIGSTQHADNDKHHDAKPAAQKGEGANVGALAHKLVLDAHGDPKALAQLISALEPAARDAVMAEAAKTHGNAFVQATFAALNGKLTEPAMNVGGKFATDDMNTGAGSHQRDDGVQGMESHGSMVQGSSTGGQSAAHDAASKAKKMSAAERKYGSTFGGQRLWGDGGGSPILGQGPGWKDSRGNAGMFGDGAFDSAEGANSGSTAPAPTAMPGSGGSSGKGPDLLMVAGPAHNMDGGTPMSQGDHAGTVAGTNMNHRGTMSAAFTAVVSGGSTSGPVDHGHRIGPKSSNSTTPREDQDGGGGPVVLSAADGHAQGNQITKAMATHGKGDGRGDRDASSSSSVGGVATTDRQQAGGERATEASGGKINWETALKINQLVNPGAS